MNRSEEGFTLVETIIALSITSVLMFIIISFMTNSIAQYAVINTRSELLNEAQIAVDTIANDTRLSGNADANNRWQDNNAPESPADNYSWESGQNTLVLATAVEDDAGEIIFADPNLYISEKNNNVYFIQSGALYKRTVASPINNNSKKTTCPIATATANCPADKQLLTNVVEFRVRYYNDQNQEVSPTNARSIEVYVKLSKNQYSQPVSAEYKTRMVFRND